MKLPLLESILSSYLDFPIAVNWPCDLGNITQFKYYNICGDGKL